MTHGVFFADGWKLQQDTSPGELDCTTHSCRRSGRGAGTGKSDNPCSCPRNSYAWMVISIQRSELLSGHGIKGLPSAGRCRDVLQSDKAVSDGMHAGRISRRASERDAGRCGSELRWEIVPRDKETSWKPSCKIDSTGNNSTSDRLSNFPQPCQESSALSQGCSWVPSCLDMLGGGAGCSLTPTSSLSRTYRHLPVL